MTSPHSYPAAVCVPVRDEAALLPRLLDALAAQRGAGAFTLCLLLDRCSDDSAAVVAARANDLPYRVVVEAVAGGAPNAGLARRRAMALGLSVLTSGEAMILSTDADSVPDPDWLAANRAALAQADVIAGRILRDDAGTGGVQDRLEAYLDALFARRRRIDPVDWEAPVTHHCTSGASLALRAATYRALGGFEPRPAAEDARLIDAAHRAGLRVRRDAAVRVTTSARRVGRTRDGLADHLRRLDRDAAVPTVAHPADEIWRYERHALARRSWPDGPAGHAALAVALGRGVADIAAVAADAASAEAFAMRVVPERPGGARTVTLDQAVVELARSEMQVAAVA